MVFGLRRTDGPKAGPFVGLGASAAGNPFWGNPFWGTTCRRPDGGTKSGIPPERDRVWLSPVLLQRGGKSFLGSKRLAPKIICPPSTRKTAASQSGGRSGFHREIGRGGLTGDRLKLGDAWSPSERRIELSGFAKIPSAFFDLNTPKSLTLVHSSHQTGQVSRKFNPRSKLEQNLKGVLL